MYQLDELIQNIYEMQESCILTPYNLLENAKLKNYSYVKYYTNEDGLFVSEMQCVCADGMSRIFIYLFDDKDRLIKVTATPGTLLKTDLLFDRQIELKILLGKYQEAKESLIQKSAG